MDLQHGSAFIKNAKIHASTGMWFIEFLFQFKFTLAHLIELSPKPTQINFIANQILSILMELNSLVLSQMSKCKKCVFCVGRFFGDCWFTFMRYYGRCTPTARQKPLGFGATQHRHFQRNHPKIGRIQSKCHFPDCFQSGGHFDLCRMEIERFAQEPCHWFWNQFGLVAIPFPYEPTSQHCANLMSRLDHWRTWRFFR